MRANNKQAQLLSARTNMTRARNEPSRMFHNNGEGLLLVESLDSILNVKALIDTFNQ